MSTREFTAEAVRGRAPRRLRTASGRVDWRGLALLAPAAALILGIFVAPVGYAFYLGFTDVTLGGPTSRYIKFTGFSNLSELIHDSLFWQSLEQTVIFIALSAIVGTTVVGMLLALLLQRSSRTVARIVGGLAIVAWIIPPLTTGILWFTFTTAGGTLSAVIGGDPLFSAPLLIVGIANIWALAGFAMLVLGSALRGVPEEVLEAASLEGASEFQKLIRVTLPMIRHTIIATVLIVVLLSLANFTLIFVMTGGGPGTATNILPVYSYLQAFSFNRLGYGALIADVVVVLGILGAYGFVRAATRGEYDRFVER